MASGTSNLRSEAGDGVMLNYVGSSEAVPELSGLIKDAILALKELRSHHYNAVKKNTCTPEENPGTLENTTTATASPNKLKTLLAVHKRSDTLEELDVLIAHFESIFPSEQWTTAQKDRADAVSQRSSRRSRFYSTMLPTKSWSWSVELDGQQQKQQQQLQQKQGLNQQKQQQHQQKQQQQLLKQQQQQLKQQQQQIEKKDGELAQLDVLHQGLLSDLSYYRQALSQLQNEDQQCRSKLEKADKTIEALRTRIATLEADKHEMERRNQSLAEQITKMEDKRSEETVAGGVYSVSEADPTTLVTAVGEMKRSLSDFARTLMDQLGTQDAKAKFVQVRHAGMEFRSRKSDIKYVFQEWAAEVALDCLWESAAFSYECVPHDQGIEKTKTFFFQRYRQLMSTHASDVFARLLASQGSTCEVCAQSHHVCHCGWMSFHQFFLDKRKALVEDSGYRSLSIRGDLETVSQETAGSALGQLLQDFVALITSAWRLYLLTLAFEQPATLFKVGKGARFSPALMEAPMVDIDPSADNQAAPAVAFMIIPGFRVGKSVIKSFVYVSPDPPGQTPGEPSG